MKYDISGKVLGVAGDHGIEFYKTKGWKTLGTMYGDRGALSGFT